MRLDEDARRQADADGRQVRAAVRGDRDPGYGSTSKIIAETGLCLVQDCTDVSGGSGSQAAAMGEKLIARLARAGVAFEDETPQPGLRPRALARQ